MPTNRAEERLLSPVIAPCPPPHLPGGLLRPHVGLNAWLRPCLLPLLNEVDRTIGIATDAGAKDGCAAWPVATNWPVVRYRSTPNGRLVLPDDDALGFPLAGEDVVPVAAELFAILMVIWAVGNKKMKA